MRTIARILVVEDNQDIQSLLHDVLVPDYEVTAALDGVQALQESSKESFDLIILDLMLPGVTGESVLKRIRRTSETPVLVLTAIQDKSRIVSLLEAGANDYLTKPFDIDELLARVRVQLRSSNGLDTAMNPDDSSIARNTANRISVDDVSLEPATHRVWVGEQEIVLPRKEFSLLQVLMRNPKQVFSKQKLYELVWDEPYIGAENTLNVHLSNLRTKINDAAPGSVKYIVAIWGIGVRFE